FPYTTLSRSREWREAAAPDRGLMRVPEHARFHRCAVALPIVGEELALEPRDVDADGAFRFAGPALEAEIPRLVHTPITEAGLAQPAGDRQPQHVGAAARRMLLLARRHVRRAHGAFERLAAHAEAAAHLDGAGHAAGVEVEERDRIAR